MSHDNSSGSAPGVADDDFRRTDAGSLRGQAWRGVLWVSGGSGLQAVLQIAVLLILARLLTPEQFGLVGAALVVTSFGAMFAQLGVGPAVVQRPGLTPEHIRAAGTLSILFGLATWIIVWQSAGAIEAFFRIEGVRAVVTAVAFMFPLKGLGLVSEALLQRHMRFRLLATTEVAAYAIGYAGCGIALAFAGYGVWALVGAYLTHAVVRTVLVVWAARPSFRPCFDMAVWRDLLHFGVGHTAGNIGGFFAEQSDNLIVGRWLGAELLGYYGRAFQFLSVPARIFGIVTDRVLFPVMSRGQSRRTGLASGYLDSINLISTLTIPASIALCLLSPETVRIVLGPGWEGAVVPLRILALSLCFRMTAKIGKSLARAQGAVYATATRQWIFALLMFAFALAGKRWGLGGVAAGVLLANACYWVATLQLSGALLELRWPAMLKAFAPGTALGILWAVVGAGMLPWLRSTGVPPLPTAAIALLVWLALTVVVWRLLPAVFLGAPAMAVMAAVPRLRFIAGSGSMTGRSGSSRGTE